jgi:hypothetical protein
VGSHSPTLACHSDSDTMRPSGATLIPASAPMLRWKALCGTFSLNGMPAFSSTRFQRSTPATLSLM